MLELEKRLRVILGNYKHGVISYYKALEFMCKAALETDINNNMVLLDDYISDLKKEYQSVKDSVQQF